MTSLENGLNVTKWADPLQRGPMKSTRKAQQIATTATQMGGIGGGGGVGTHIRHHQQPEPAVPKLLHREAPTATLTADCLGADVRIEGGDLAPELPARDGLAVTVWTKFKNYLLHKRHVIIHRQCHIR